MSESTKYDSYQSEVLLFKHYRDNFDELTENDINNINKIMLKEGTPLTKTKDFDKPIKIIRTSTGNFPTYMILNSSSEIKQIYVFKAEEDETEIVLDEGDTIYTYGCKIPGQHTKRYLLIILAILATAFVYGLTTAILGGKGGIIVVLPFIFILGCLVKWIKGKF